MSKPIRVDYTFNQEAFLTAQNYHVRFSGRRMRWLRWGYLGITVATVTAVLVTQTAIHPMMLVILAMGYIGVIVSEVLQHPRMLARAVKKRFETNMYREQKVSFVMEEKALTTRTDGQHETEMIWDTFHKIVETPDGFLLYLNKQVFLWLPLRALSPKTAQEQLQSIWRTHKIECVKI